jgi:hypothetical protein
MSPELWRRKIGETSWDMIKSELNRFVNGQANTGDLVVADPEEVIAAVLTKACALGFSFPEEAPTVTPQGTKMIWPTADNTQRASLTAQGLEGYYARRGAGFYLLRMPQLLRACAPTQMLARLQEILAAYEEQCHLEGVDPLPKVGGRFWRVFVGGRDDLNMLAEREVPMVLKRESPKPDHSGIQRVTKRKMVGQ